MPVSILNYKWIVNTSQEYNTYRDKEIAKLSTSKIKRIDRLFTKFDSLDPLGRRKRDIVFPSPYHVRNQTTSPGNQNNDSGTNITLLTQQLIDSTSIPKTIKAIICGEFYKLNRELYKYALGNLPEEALTVYPGFGDIIRVHDVIQTVFNREDITHKMFETFVNSFHFELEKGTVWIEPNMSLHNYKNYTVLQKLHVLNTSIKYSGVNDTSSLKRTQKLLLKRYVKANELQDVPYYWVLASIEG